jgi:hypothetical protein
VSTSIEKSDGQRETKKKMGEKKVQRWAKMSLRDCQWWS